MRGILIFPNCEGQSHKTVSTDHSLWSERRAEADSNWGPSAYQPTTLPLGQSDSHPYSLSSFCFTSTEARWLIRDGDGGRGGGDERVSEGSERPWTAARTMEVLRRCPLAIAQRLVHCAITVSTAILGQSHQDNVRCSAIEEQLEAKEVQLSHPSSTSLLMISSGLNEGPAPPPSSWSVDLVWNLAVPSL